MELSKKQQWAFNLLTDNETVSVGFGGAAYGGKTVLGCYFNLVMHSELRGSKSFIGRDSLKDTRESVLFTFRKVSKMLNITNWTYSDNHIKFKNGSEIEFLDLTFYPQKDPLYERFGSKEYTWGWIEEAGPVHPLAYDVLKSRINRWFNKEFKLIGKILVTFNPKKNWVDSTFYRPWKKGKEKKHTKFIYALPSDNIDPDPIYMENLRNIKDKQTRERLLHGNFDYQDDPTTLIQYDTIQAIWTNYQVNQPKDKYIIVDAARFGSDRALVTVWEGLKIIEYHKFDISSTVTIQNCIKAMRIKHNIRSVNVIVDDDGVGGGIVDNAQVCGFVNNSSPVDKAYYNLKCECGYLLAEKIDGIFVECDVSEQDKQDIEEELAQLKTFDADKDGKLRILPKAKIKENIGRSPDWLDVFIMRMWFFLFHSELKDEVYRQALRLLN